MARRRVLYAAALLGAVLFQIYSTGYVAAFLLALTVALPVLSLALSLPAMLGCRVQVAPERGGVTRGEKTFWVVAVENRRRLPVSRITVKLETANRMTGWADRRRLRLSGASSPERLAFPADTAHCGMLACRALRVSVCDSLGLFSLRRRAAGAALLPVLPAAADAPELPALDAQCRGGTTLQVRRGGGAGEDYDLRPYRPGDPVRLIHWKLSSKRGEWIFREILEARQVVPLLTLDHVGAPEQMDRLLDRLYALSGALLERQRDHVICWLEPLTGALREYRISGQRELQRCLDALLSDPAPAAGRTLSAEPAAVPGCPGQVRIHLSVDEEEGA